MARDPAWNRSNATWERLVERRKITERFPNGKVKKTISLGLVWIDEREETYKEHTVDGVTFMYVTPSTSVPQPWYRRCI